MSAHPFNPPPADTIEQNASAWMSRRDRGLTAAEQDAYLQWLREDTRHGAAITRLEKVWGILDQLSEWRPKHSPQPNPDLLAPKRRGRIYWLASSALAAAAAVAMLFFIRPDAPARPQGQVIIHPGPERMVLEDGSVVELNAGAKVLVNFTPEERRVELVSGEAYFTVAKNPNRPFIVSADKIAVRAVGTAFSVSLGQREVSVLVTEGKVQVDETAATGAEAPHNPLIGEHDGSGSCLAVGQQANFTLTPNAPTVSAVQDVTPAQIERSLSWQAMRLEFVEMSLRNVVVEFNRYNRQHVTIGDAETAAILVDGNFRADNVEAFVRLVDSSFGVTASRSGDEIVLRKTR